MEKKKWKFLVQGIAYLAVFALFIVMVVFLNSTSNNSGKEEMDWTPEVKEYPEGLELVAKNESMELYFEPAAVQFIVKDTLTGTEWRSNPENAENDMIAFGQNKTAVRSLISVTYVDDQSSYYTINSFAACVKDKTYTYEYKDNGVYLNLQFAKQGFEIPCFFGIENDRFVARVFSSQIKQHGSLKVAEIALLPYFGAGSLEDEGYMVVPDGSGALIYYNNQKQTYQSYAQRIYGNNLALNVQSSTKVAEDATMPVFGIKRNNEALLAVITQGEYQAEIRAEIARKTTSNNAIYSNIVYIQGENNTLLSGSDNEESTVMISPQHNQTTYEISYYFLEESAGYSEMAARYHRYLVEEKGMQSAKTTEQKRANLTFLGGVKVRKTLLGIPYHTVEPLTSFSELSEIALKLQKDSGNCFQVSMYHIEKGGSESKIPTSLTYEGALGGKKGYQKMAQALSAAGIPFYPVYDPVTIKKSGNGYHTLDGVRNVSRSASIQYEYLLTTGAKDTSKTPYYLVSPKYINKIVASMLKSAQKKEVEKLGISNLANSVYSDFRKDSISANETGAYWQEALKQAADSLKELLLQGAYAYAFPYADVITEVPISSSQYDIEDESIPFYQMAVGGSAALYSKPVNQSGNVRELILRSIEYGVSPSFLLMAAEADTLKDTDYQKYYSVAFKDWQQEIQSILMELSELDTVFGQGIIAHKKIQENIYAATYKDGTVVYVNYGEKDIDIDGITVPAMGFYRKGGK